MMCPNCKSTEYKEARQCPLYDGKAVCIDCCYKCGFYEKDNIYCCGFYIRKREEKADKELLRRKELIILKKELKKYKHNPKMAEYLQNKIKEIKK